MSDVSTSLDLHGCYSDTTGSRKTQTEIMAGDVFAHSALTHPALMDGFTITPDIYATLFDGYINGTLFNRWLRYKEAWPLDIVGGPGAGKTTFAAILARHIRESYLSTHQSHSYLATIFIGDGRVDNDIAFVEDFLRSLYIQLTPSGARIGSAVSDRHNEYESARDKGRKASLRINLISQALKWRIAEIDVAGQAFLILDHLDQCGPALRELLERELSALHCMGLKIMTTSRLPRYEETEAMGARVCDFHGAYFETDLYWHCDRCEQDICESCKGDDQYCRECDVKSRWTQPAYFTIFIDSINARTMQDFVAWDLEREHGNLGLGTLATSLQPPFSLFGVNFRKLLPTNDAGRDWIRGILDYVGSNVLQVKLALDRIHTSASPEYVDLNPERLPANVQAVFNEGIKAINQRADNQVNLALKSIAVVGKTGTPFEGTSVSSLAASLNQRRPRSSSTHLPPRSAEDVLEACHGFLRLLTVGGKVHMVTFIRRFHDFIFDEYNEDLILAFSQLRTSNIPRSVTHSKSVTPKAPQNKSWVDVIEGLKRYKSPDLPSTIGLGSPTPFRRESSGLIRSQTFLPVGSSSISSSAGLGLDFSWDRA